MILAIISTTFAVISLAFAISSTRRARVAYFVGLRDGVALAERQLTDALGSAVEETAEVKVDDHVQSQRVAARRGMQ